MGAADGMRRGHLKPALQKRRPLVAISGSTDPKISMPSILARATLPS